MEMMAEERPNDTPARWAFRFVGSQPRVMVVLSGMTLLDHLKENIKTYSPLDPMTEREKEILEEAADIIATYQIPCTLQVCVPCPYGVDIPGIFLYFNKATYDSNVPEPRWTTRRGVQEGLRAFWSITTVLFPSWNRPITASIVASAYQRVLNGSGFPRNYSE